jgi:protocatechuate 3,4-dioxygenase beta subunit/5-hydroxyisourate hydrolase-like protein (transthyretin family)
MAVLCIALGVVFVGKLPSVQGQAVTTGVSSEPGKIAGKQITYTGKVVDEQGRSIADAKVSLHQITYSGEAFLYEVKFVEEVGTKADGAFSFRIVADTEGYRQGIIVAEKQSLAVGWDNWEMHQDKHRDVTLCRPKQLTGLVIDENSNPIADAEVSISIALAGEGDDRRYLTDLVAPQLLTVKTDASGSFTFERLPADATFEFRVKKAGRATASTFNSTGNREERLQFVPGQTDIKLVMLIEAKIEGTVVEKTSGNPVAGVRLVVLEQQRGLPFDLRTIVSKEDGTFSMGSLTAGKKVLQIVPPAEGTADWVVEQVEVTTEAGKTADGVKVEVSKGGLLEVVVKDAETKKPLEKAGVSVHDQQSDKWLSARTDKDGIARIRLTPGEYQVSGVYKQGYTSESRQEAVTIEDGATKRVEWLLAGQPKITGVVRDEAGKAVEGVKFKILPAGGPQEATSDSQGRFEQSWDPRRGGSEPTVHYLVARHKERNLAVAVEIDEHTKKLDIELKPGVIFTGKVVDPNGKGIADGSITVMLRASNWGSSIEYRETKTDAQGKFEVNAIPPEHRYNLTAMAEGYGQKQVDVQADDAVDNHLNAGQLELAVANLSVSGVVVDANDKPVEGARVSCNGGDGQPERDAQTNAEGKFTLDKVCQGRIRINANVSGKTYKYGYVETEAGATDVKIVVSESSSGTRYIPKQPPSLLGKALPDLKQLKIDLPSEDSENKIILVCFWDMQQRPSRHCVTEVAKQAEQLKQEGVTIVAVQASKIDVSALKEWVEKYNIPFPVGTVEGDVEKTNFAWGVRSLPWLILTNRSHTVTAEGFAAGALTNKIKEITDAKL